MAPFGRLQTCVAIYSRSFRLPVAFLHHLIRARFTYLDCDRLES
jgi:hypothetical protein